MAWPTRRTGVRASSRSWWWAGKPGVLQSMGSQRIGCDWATELNWTERSPNHQPPGNSLFTLFPNLILSISLKSCSVRLLSTFTTYNVSLFLILPVVSMWLYTMVNSQPLSYLDYQQHLTLLICPLIWYGRCYRCTDQISLTFAISMHTSPTFNCQYLFVWRISLCMLCYKMITTISLVNIHHSGSF